MNNWTKEKNKLRDGYRKYRGDIGRGKNIGCVLMLCQPKGKKSRGIRIGEQRNDCNRKFGSDLKNSGDYLEGTTKKLSKESKVLSIKKRESN